MTGDQENNVTEPDVTKVTEQESAEKLTMEMLKHGIDDKIKEMKKNVFAVLKEVETQRIIDYLIDINLGPLVDYYGKKPDGDKKAVEDVFKNVWPEEGEQEFIIGFLKSAVPKGGDLIPSIHSLLETEEFEKRSFEPLMEKLLSKTDTMMKMQEYFSAQEHVLKQLRSELSELHSVGKFSSTVINLPSEQLAKTSISRGDLRIEVDVGRAVIIAGNEFSIFVKIINPFDVPIVLYSVETQIPVDLKDHSPKCIDLCKQEKPKWNLTDIPRKFLDDFIEGLGVDRSPESRVAQGIATSDLEYLKVGLKPQPILLQPDDSIVKQFIFKTKSRWLFTPIALNLEIQVKYGVDYREHLDTVKSELTIQADLMAVILGSILGGVAGFIIRYLTSNDNGFKGSVSFSGFFDFLTGFFIAFILSAMVVVAFARKSGAQKIITIEDFFGGLFLGFMVGYSDPKTILGVITDPTDFGNAFNQPAQVLVNATNNLTSAVDNLNSTINNLGSTVNNTTVIK